MGSWSISLPRTPCKRTRRIGLPICLSSRKGGVARSAFSALLKIKRIFVHLFARSTSNHQSLLGGTNFSVFAHHHFSSPLPPSSTQIPYPTLDIFCPSTVHSSPTSSPWYECRDNMVRDSDHFDIFFSPSQPHRRIGTRLLPKILLICRRLSHVPCFCDYHNTPQPTLS